MFGFLRSLVNDSPDPEFLEGLKNFLILIGSIGGAAVMMAFVANWLSHI